MEMSVGAWLWIGCSSFGALYMTAREWMGVNNAISSYASSPTLLTMAMVNRNGEKKRKKISKLISY